MNTTDAESNWTPTPPTEPGLYYWRTHDGDNKLRCREIWQGIYQLVVETGIPLEEFGGEWGGHCPAPGTMWTVQEFLTWIHDVVSNSTFRFIDPIINDPQDGIAAVTLRGKENG